MWINEKTRDNLIWRLLDFLFSDTWNVIKQDLIMIQFTVFDWNFEIAQIQMKADFITPQAQFHKINSRPWTMQENPAKNPKITKTVSH